MKYTYRDLFTRLLPEPYLSQAIANALAEGGAERVDDPTMTSGVVPDSLADVLLSAFAWKQTPEGWDYWKAASQGRFAVAKVQLEPGKRYLTRDGRAAEVEGRDRTYSEDSPYAFDGSVDGDAGFCWSVTGRYEKQRENPLDLVEEVVSAAVDPGEGYRLLEVGETILEGDEEADAEEGGGWSKILFFGDAYKPRNWFPVRREIPGPPKPPVYRLLNPGEIIREGDEALADTASDLGEVDEWAPSTTVDEPVDPQRHLPIRRQIKSYEDS